MKIKTIITKYFWRSAIAVSLAVVTLLFIGIANFNSRSVAAPRVKTPLESATAPANEATLAAAVNLTGVWKGDDGATYYIRHIPGNIVTGEVEDDVYWFGQGNGFGNVFHGKTVGIMKQFSGKWADVPIGGAKNSGFLNLFIASPDRLVKMSQKGNFNARVWERVKAGGKGDKPNPPKIKLKKP